jgi:hypothetical protein
MICGMCVICDGATPDEFLFDLHGKIERYGWTCVAVEAGHDNPSWAYTIGLSDRFDHPELVMVGLPPPDAYWVLGQVARHVRDGAGVEVGERILVPRAGIDVLVGDVDPDQWELGTFNQWLNYYGALGPPYPEQRAVQLILPAGRRGPRPHLAQPLLSEPHDVLHERRPDRGERRARRRPVPGRRP